MDDIYFWVVIDSCLWFERILKDDFIVKFCGRRSILILYSILEKEIEVGRRVIFYFLIWCVFMYYGMMIVVFNLIKLIRV